eukprot:CFRG6324T1
MLQRNNPTFFEVLLAHWLDQLCLFVVTLFFSEIDILGHENLTKYGPAIYVGNHQNQFMDAVLLSAVVKSEQNRGVRFIIAEKSYHRPLIGGLSRLMNCIPVARPQDSAKKGIGTVSVKKGENVVRGDATTFTVDFEVGDSIKVEELLYKVVSIESDKEMTITGINSVIEETVIDYPNYKIYKKTDQHKMYGSVYDNFVNGGLLGIFPEGGSHDRTELLPLKAGVCIMALGAMTHHPELKVNVVPCGINYSAANQFRSKVVIQFGPPIVVDRSEVELYKTDKHKAIGGLLERVTSGLQDVVVQTPDHEALVTVHYMRKLYVPVGRSITPSEHHELNQRFSKAYKDTLNQEIFHKIKLSILEYRADLRRSALSDNQIVKMQTAVQMGRKRQAFYEMLGHVTLIVGYIITYLPGFLLALPVGIIVELVAAMKRKEALESSDVKVKALDVVASWKVMTSIVVIPALTAFYCFLFFLYLVFATEFNATIIVCLLLVCMIFVPFYCHQSILAGDDVMKAIYAVRPLFLRASGAFQSRGEKWIHKRAKLQKLIRTATMEYFDHMYPGEARIIKTHEFKQEEERMDETRNLRRKNTTNDGE